MQLCGEVCFRTERFQFHFVYVCGLCHCISFGYSVCVCVCTNVESVCQVPCTDEAGCPAVNETSGAKVSLCEMRLKSSDQAAQINCHGASGMSGVTAYVFVQRAFYSEVTVVAQDTDV